MIRLTEKQFQALGKKSVSVPKQSKCKPLANATHLQKASSRFRTTKEDYEEMMKDDKWNRLIQRYCKPPKDYPNE